MCLDVKIEELHTRHCRYNKMAFLLECLEDIDTQLWYHGGRLNLVEGEPAAVIKELSKHFAIQRICFDQVAEKIPKTTLDFSIACSRIEKYLE